MKCPHCLVEFHAIFSITYIGVPAMPGLSRTRQLEDADGAWSVSATVCPSCGRSTIWLVRDKTAERMIRPMSIARAPLPREVPDAFTADYKEACLVLADSAKASAALGRRCLQHLLRERVKVKPADLANEIQELLDSNILPSDLADDLDAIRNIGNFSAHPIKSTNTGEIVDVEPGEAEWTLTVLEELFDFYFVRPTRSAAKRAALNAKLAEAGKPPMKRSRP